MDLGQHSETTIAGAFSPYLGFRPVNELWYDPSMTVDHFKQSLDGLTIRKPFHPFIVELHGRRRFEVDFSNAVVFRDGVAVFVAPGGVPILFDHESVTAIVGETAGSAA
jgi:hypothetical protein